MGYKRCLPLACGALGALTMLVALRLVPSAQAQEKRAAPVPTPVPRTEGGANPDRGQGGSSVAVVTRGGGGVYIVRDSTVYLLDARSLKVLRQMELPPPGTPSPAD